MIRRTLSKYEVQSHSDTNIQLQLLQQIGGTHTLLLPANIITNLQRLHQVLRHTNQAQQVKHRYHNHKGKLHILKGMQERAQDSNEQSESTQIIQQPILQSRVQQMGMLMEQFMELGLQSQTKGDGQVHVQKAQKSIDIRKLPTSLNNVYKKMKEDGISSMQQYIIQILSCFPSTKFITNFTNHIKQLLQRKTVQERVDQVVTNSLTHLSAYFSNNPSTINNTHQYPQTIVWKNIYTQILCNNHQQLYLTLFQYKEDQFAQLYKQYLSIMDGSISQSSQYNEYVQDVKVWYKVNKTGEDVYRQQLCQYLLGIYSNHNTIISNSKQYQLWKLLSNTVKWLKCGILQYRESERKVDQYLLGISRMHLHRQQLVQLFMYQQAYRQIAQVDRLCYLCVFNIMHNVLIQIGNIFNSQLTKQYIQNELVMLVKDIDNRQLVLSILPLIQEEYVLQILVNDSVLVRKIDWDRFNSIMVNIRDKRVFMRQLAVRSVKLYGNLSYFLNLQGIQFVLQLQLLQICLGKYLMLHQQMTNSQIQSILPYIIGLRKANIQGKQCQIINVQMLFICHIFREAMIDRKVKTICSYLSLFLDKESHRNEQFPMLSSRRQRPLVQMNSWYIKQIGQEQHIQYLLSRQQHLQIYLGLVQLVGRGIELVIKSNSKYVKLSQCQLWLVELVDKLNIGYRFCRGSQKKKFENRKNYLFKICPSIH